jgi:hypothetical protein
MERPMNRFAGLFLAFAVSLAAIPTPAAAQDKSLTIFAAASMKNALDEIDSRLHRENRRQDHGELCRKLGIGKTDRTGRAGRRLHLRRHRLDGLRDRKERHQRAEPGSICSATASC